MNKIIANAEVLSRNEMKSIQAGNLDSCGSSCEGCIPDNTSSGYPCVEWKCIDGEWCFPENSYCCITIGEA